MKWKWIDADCTSVTTAEGTLTLKGLFIPLFIEQLLMNMTGTVNTLMLGHYADDAVAAVGAANQVIGFLYTFYAVFSGGASVVISHRLGAGDEKRASDAAQCHLDKDCFIVRNSYTADKHFVYLLYFYLITLLT